MCHIWQRRSNTLRVTSQQCDRLHICSGYELKLKKCIRLRLICRGIKRSQDDSTRIRLPTTITHLKLSFNLLAIPTVTNFDSIMTWAAMILAFFGFLRLGKMTCNSSYSSAFHLSPGDIAFYTTYYKPEYMSIRVKISKTNPFRSGHTIIIGRTNENACPVMATKNYLSSRGTRRVHYSSICLAPLSQKRGLRLKPATFDHVWFSAFSLCRS